MRSCDPHIKTSTAATKKQGRDTTGAACFPQNRVTLMLLSFYVHHVQHASPAAPKHMRNSSILHVHAHGDQQLAVTPYRVHTSRRSRPNWSSPCDRWDKLSRFQVGNPGFQSCRSVTFGHTSSLGVPSSLVPAGQDQGVRGVIHS